ncbi:MAG: hypothetical protein ACHQPI_05405 [Thermoanaerobaculia bacterium]
MRQPLPVFLLALAVVGPGSLAMAEDKPAAPASATAISPPLPIGVEADVYCTGWIDNVGVVFPASIFSAERVDSKQGLFEGDIVYVSAGTKQGVAAGQEYWVVRPDRTVYKTGSVLDVLGRVYLTPGRIRVLCAQDDAAIAEIVLSCSDINVGDSLLPFEPVPVPLVRRTAPLSSCDPSSGKVSGHIVDDFDSVTAIMKNSIVYLDLGEEDGVMPGDFFSVYRVPSSEYAVRIMLGEASILTTKRKTSVAIITAMRDTMYAGDRVEMK